MWAARPHLASIFEKLLEQKTFCLPAARYLETMLLKKTVFRVRQKGVPPLLLPTSVLQLPRCLVWICNLDSHDTTLFELDSFKNAIAAGKQSCKIQFASQTWAARPHLGSIFEKLLHRKTFCLPAAHHWKQCTQKLDSQFPCSSLNDYTATSLPQSFRLQSIPLLFLPAQTPAA